MPRRPSLNIIGVPQHVIQRGNNRQAVFFADSDYRFYLDTFTAAAQRHGCRLHAYVLMTNHVHLLVTPEAPHALSLTMRDAGRRYVQQYVNASYGRTGTLWEGRYKAILVDAEKYFFACCRYIELNPVRADMVKHAADYRWSSYRHNALGSRDPYVVPHAEYTALGKTDAERQSAYRRVFDDADESLEEIRHAVTRGWPLGRAVFSAMADACLAAALQQPAQRGGALPRRA